MYQKVLASYLWLNTDAIDEELFFTNASYSPSRIRWVENGTTNKFIFEAKLLTEDSINFSLFFMQSMMRTKKALSLIREIFSMEIGKYSFVVGIFLQILKN